MRTQLKSLTLVFVYCLCSSITVLAQTDPNAPTMRTITTRDPQTGRTTTQQVPVGPANSESAQRTITTRDPQTGRTVTQQIMSGEAMMQQRLVRFQQSLELGDQQWERVKPVLTKVLQLRLALNPSVDLRNRAVSMQPGQSRGDMVLPQAQPADIGNPDKELGAAFDKLLEATRNAEATDEQITEAMQNYTQKRQTIEEELKAAQVELKNMLTIRQQAQLTLEGISG